jgi:hypothetical protein
MRRAILLATLFCLVNTAAEAQIAPRSLRLDLPPQTTVTPSSELTLEMQIGEFVGVNALQVFKFGFEYDSRLVEILDVRPGSALAAWPAGDILVEFSSGLVRVTGLTGAPVTVNDGQFLLVDLRMGAELYDGERPRIRVVGPQPGEPILFLEDAGDPGTGIRVVAPDAGLKVVGGVSCLAGDALGDGAVDAGDASAILRIVAGLILDPGVALRCGADADADGDIDSGDAVVALRRAVGLPRTDLHGQPEPALRLEPHDGGLVLRLTDAAAVHGAQFGVMFDDDVELIDIHSDGMVPVATRIGPADAYFATASANPLADDLGEFEVFVEFNGPGRVRIVDVELFAADGVTLRRIEETEFTDVHSSVSRAGLRLSNTPNPFNPATTFWLEIPVAGRVVLDLFDIRGRHLATLFDESRPAGRSQWKFDARSVGGGVLASGVYFARLQTLESSTVHRVTLLK